MKKIVIFSGTTEGRRLSELLSNKRIKHTVCVATQYGSDVMEENAYACIRVGRMDAAGMEAFFGEAGVGAGDFVVDATHPYASEVTGNIKAAAATVGADYIRIRREVCHSSKDGIVSYDTLADCARAMGQTEGNILLTTGSNELKDFCKQLSDEAKARLYVRILPSEESFLICKELGIKNIIAMQGPFSYECNRAIFAQYGIRELVTKESGAAGGFEEKIRAAGELGIRVHVLTCPAQEEGISLGEAYRRLTGEDVPIKRRITVAGYGPGGGCFTGEVQAAIADADVVFGAARLLEKLSAKRKYAMYTADEILSVLSQEDFEKIVILFTGDVGFYSGAKSVIPAIRAWDKDADLRVLPGISSVSYLAAKCLVSYEDAAILSLHGKEDVHNIHALIETVRYHKKTFVLLSSGEQVQTIAKRLLERAYDCKLTIGCNLTLPMERIRTLSLEEAKSFAEDGICTLYIEHAGAIRRPLFPICPDTDFLRDKVPMTKESIRHESLLRLHLQEGDVVYDIGGGTGSVAIEAALIDPSLKVYSFEKDETACALIEENKKRCHAEHLTLVRGTAPEAFDNIEDPDCVFIGGSGGRLQDILKALTARKKGIRFVINAVSLETIDAAMHIIDAYETKEMQIVQLSCSEIRDTGRHHLMQAINPVMIFSFVI